MMKEMLMDLNTTINDLVWGPPMLLLLVGVGVLISLRTRFIQFSQFGKMWHETMGSLFRKGEKKRGEGDVSPFQALTVAMGGTVGVGNIAGVATAIAAGGPGALFWMLVSGIVGMATKYAEVLLGVHYRKREPNGPMLGGAMMYIERGLGPKWKWLAIVFSLFGALAAFGIGNMTQSQAVATGMAESVGMPTWVTGVILVVAVGLVTIGGIKRIAHVAMFCVPFMTVIYILAALAVIAMNVSAVPAAVSLVFKHAFTPTAATGGFAGVGVMMAIRFGIARGVFSNEAGMGSAPMAHATAATDHPARQGLWGVFEVFFDTLVMCSLTALVILLTGAWTSGENGAGLTIYAFSQQFGSRAGSIIVTLCMVLTAYDTILAWCFYGETCAAYMIGHGKIVRTIYRVAWLPFIMLGATGQLDVIWKVSDTLNGLMALPNLIALVVLSGVVVKLTRGFLKGEAYELPDDA